MPYDDDRSPSTIALAGTEGVPVVTSEGAEIGRVNAVRGVYFEVDLRAGGSYWLTQDQVDVATVREMRLNCAEDEIARDRLERPGPGPRAAASPGPDQAGGEERTMSDEELHGADHHLNASEAHFEYDPMTRRTPEEGGEPH